MYHAVLYDMDGVVVDTERSVADFWQVLARSHGFSLSSDDLERDVHGRSADHTLRVLFPGIGPDRYGEVYQRLRKNNESLRYSAIAGATRLLLQLSAAGVPLALVTGAYQWKVAEVLSQLGLTETFNVQVRAEDVAVGKPDPSCYLLAAQRLAVSIDRCLVFEDAVSGVTSAVTAGASCVALAPERRTVQMSGIGAITVVPDFRDITFSTHPDVLRVGREITFPFSVPRGARSPLAAKPVDQIQSSEQ